VRVARIRAYLFLTVPSRREVMAVMSIHKLVAGDGYAYLTRQVAAGDAGLEPGASLTAYYEATGNPPGRWCGAGLAALGIEPAHRVQAGDRVSEAAMAAVFRDGHDPVTGEPLGRGFGGESPVVGFDLTFTALKSVSVLWGLGDDTTRAAVYAAHRAALGQALAFVERTVVRTRVGDGGCRQVATRGMIAAAFDHWDTRAGDPNLHTHVVLANKVQGPDGLWRSLDGKAVYAAVVTVSELYDTLLADELARRMPVAFSRRDRGPRRNPAFEVDGIGEDVLALFSARAEQIHNAEVDWAATFETEHGRAPTRVETTRARQHLARATRPPKVVRPLRDLRVDWANRARTLTGLEPVDLAARALAGTYGRALHAHDVGPEVRAAMLAQVVDEVSTKRSVWTTWNLGAAALRASKPLRMASPEHRLRLLNDLTVSAEAACVHLDDTRDPERRRTGESLFTSTELLAAEKTLIDAATTETRLPRRSDDPRSPLVRMGRALDGLAGDQRAAAEAIMTSPHLLDALVGPAGSGNTTTLTALALIWRTNCGPVLGLAPSATAAHTLEHALGVPCQTTAKWLYESVGPGAHTRAATYARPTEAEAGATDFVAIRDARALQARARAEQDRWRLTPGQLVIIDEASLADTRTLAEIVAQARAADARVLLVGDHLQRGSVDAGGAFAMLARRGPTAELTSLWRFTHPWEARASLELRRAHPGVLDTYDAHGAISGGTRDQMLTAALTAWTDARENGHTAVLQAADNHTVRDLNSAARAAGIRAGTVTHDGVELHDGLIAGVGDRIVTRHNHRRLHTADGFVRNGDLWDIAAVGPDGSLKVRPADSDGHRGDRGIVRLPADYVAEHVELGYATTTARTQGITADQTHTIAAPGMAREDLYVGMSRGRHLNRTYVITEPAHDECLPDRAQPSPSALDILRTILATSHAQQSATETWETYHPSEPPPIPPVHPEQSRPRSAMSASLSSPSYPRSASHDGPVLSM
jgi:conjugative relaxase-like TrwC/TraI family protein